MHLEKNIYIICLLVFCFGIGIEPVLGEVFEGDFFIQNSERLLAPYFVTEQKLLCGAIVYTVPFGQKPAKVFLTKRASDCYRIPSLEISPGQDFRENIIRQVTTDCPEFFRLFNPERFWKNNSDFGAFLLQQVNIFPHGGNHGKRAFIVFWIEVSWSLVESAQNKLVQPALFEQCAWVDAMCLSRLNKVIYDKDLGDLTIFPSFVYTARRHGFQQVLQKLCLS